MHVRRAAESGADYVYALHNCTETPYLVIRGQDRSTRVAIARGVTGIEADRTQVHLHVRFDKAVRPCWLCSVRSLKGSQATVTF